MFYRYMTSCFTGIWRHVLQVYDVMFYRCMTSCFTGVWRHVLQVYDFMFYRLWRHVLQVYRLVQQRLERLEDPGGFTLQFVPRYVIHGASGVEDRWLITVETPGARRELQRGLFHTAKGFSYVVRRYDDVIKEEYQKYLRLSKMTTELLSLGQAK